MQKIFILTLIFLIAQISAETWVIINPNSGTEAKNKIEELIREKIPSCQIFYTKEPKHAKELALKAVQNGVSIVGVVGGDGTIHEAANALIGTNTALAIIPSGSGNGLARHLNIPLDTEKALDLINAAHIKTIDTIKINGESYLNIAGIGFDAHVSDLFEKEGQRGILSYIRHALKEFPNYKSRDYELLIDGKTIKRKAFLISFANSSQWGNNACIAPRAKIDDGLLDVVILSEFPKYAGLPLLLRLFTHSIDHSEYIETFTAKEVILKKTASKAHVDGEPCPFNEDLIIKVNPSSLKVLVH